MIHLKRLDAAPIDLWVGYGVIVWPLFWICVKAIRSSSMTGITDPVNITINVVEGVIGIGIVRHYLAGYYFLLITSASSVAFIIAGFLIFYSQISTLSATVLFYNILGFIYSVGMIIISTVRLKSRKLE